MSAHLSHDDFSALLRNGAAGAQTRKTGLLGSIGGALGSVFARLGAMQQRRAMIDELRQLGDRELADIGITRADIPHVFDPAFAATMASTRRAGGVSSRAATA